MNFSKSLLATGYFFLNILSIFTGNLPILRKFNQFPENFHGIPKSEFIEFFLQSKFKFRNYNFGNKTINYFYCILIQFINLS